MLHSTQSDPGPNGISVTSRSASPSEIVASPAKVLYNVMRRNISGRLVIRRSQEASMAWVVYVGEGKLQLVTSNLGEWERLSYVLKRTKSSLLTRFPTRFQGSAYQFLHHEWHSKQITENQLKIFLRLFSQEALVHVLAIPQAVIQFEGEVQLTPVLVSLSLKDLIPPIAAQIGAWKEIGENLESPLQPLNLRDEVRFSRELLPAIAKLSSTNGSVQPSQLFADQPCLYQLADRLNADILQLAQWVAQGIETQLIEVVSQKTTDEQKLKHTIVCVDDSMTIQRNVKLVLEAAGYRSVGLTNPLQALASLAREKPSLILMDISMPNLDGYELCRLLRRSTLLKDTPIIMLTGRDGFIDKMRAKVAGSTDYITKPVNTETLLATIARHLEIQAQAEGDRHE